MASVAQKAAAEFTGTAFLLAAVVGSGIMAQRLAGGNVALALLCILRGEAQVTDMVADEGDLIGREGLR